MLRDFVDAEAPDDPSRAAASYTLIQTAKLNDSDPQASLPYTGAGSSALDGSLRGIG